MKQRVFNKIMDTICDFFVGLWGICWVIAITLLSVWAVGKTLDMLLNLIGGM